MVAGVVNELAVRSEELGVKVLFYMAFYKLQPRGGRRYSNAFGVQTPTLRPFHTCQSNVQQANKYPLIGGVASLRFKEIFEFCRRKRVPRQGSLRGFRFQRENQKELKYEGLFPPSVSEAE